MQVLKFGAFWKEIDEGKYQSRNNSLRNLRNLTFEFTLVTAVFKCSLPAISRCDGWCADQKTLSISPIRRTYNSCPAAWILITPLFTRFVTSQLSLVHLVGIAKHPNILLVARVSATCIIRVIWILEWTTNVVHKMCWLQIAIWI